MTSDGAFTLRPYQRPRGVHPPLDFTGYRSSALRTPRQRPVLLPHRLTEITGPLLGEDWVKPEDADLTTQHSTGQHGTTQPSTTQPSTTQHGTGQHGTAQHGTAQHEGEPQGERIIVTGRVLDSDGRPVTRSLVEIWQTNAAGRYRHEVDQHHAPLDPNFTGAGRCLTDDEGRYRFVTIKPGSYPWRNHANAWRPAHIHFSLFGRSFTQRVVTQMYFPGDPLQALDPVLNSVPDPAARQRLVASFDIALTEPEWALGYSWDIVLRGHGATPFEAGEHP